MDGMTMDRFGGRIVLLWGWRRALVAFMAGALFALAQAPYDFFAVGFVSFTLLVWLLDGTTSASDASLIGRLRPSFAVGWFFGFGYFIAGLWWIGKALLVEGESFAWALPLAVVALPALLAIFYGLATALARIFWSDGLGRIAALAASFALVEYLRATILTGFPWNAIGYAAMPIPLLMQSVTLVGMTGMSALTVLVFAMPAQFLATRYRLVSLIIAALVAGAHVGFGTWRLSEPVTATELLPVRLVQPSILQSEKWDRLERDRIFGRYLEMSAQPLAEGANARSLIIWPETAVPFILNDRPDALAALGDLLEEGQMLLVGAVRSENSSGSGQPTRYYNSVLTIGDKGEILDAVDKVHLVPFGEYLPFSSLLSQLGLTKIVNMPGEFTAGSSRKPLTLPMGIKAAAFLCYEIIFENLVRQDAAGTDMLVNLTNDAWFGDSAGPYQHFRQAQLRAVQTGLPLIRAANSGISAVVDSYGRILNAYSVDVIGVLDVDVPIAKAPMVMKFDPFHVGWLIVLLLFLGATAGAVSTRWR